jgi:ribosome-binding protein aMBF1 (putative translation factor)
MNACEVCGKTARWAGSKLKLPGEKLRMICFDCHRDGWRFSREGIVFNRNHLDEHTAQPLMPVPGVGQGR